MPGDAFVGVVGISEGTQGIDRLAGPTSPRFDGGIVLRIVYTPFHILNMMIVPFEMQGISMHPMEEAMLSPTEGILGDALGIGGLLFLVNFFFWLMWVNILLGFTNLIPMVPFDVGHLFKDGSLHTQSNPTAWKDSTLKFTPCGWTISQGKPPACQHC